MGTRVTIKDVAAAAGVSTATVSYILNQKPNQRISPETRDRVLEAARQLQYRGGTVSIPAVPGKTDCIGIAVSGTLTLARHAHTLQGALDQLRKKHKYPILTTEELEANGRPAYINLYQSGRADGLILLGANGKPLEAQWEALIVEQRIPFVAYDCETGRHINSVDLDYLGGAIDLTSLILDRGAVALLYIRPDADTRQEREREQGVRRVAFERGIPLQIFTIPTCRAPDGPDGFQETTAFMRTAPAGTAVISSWSGYVPLLLKLQAELRTQHMIGALAHYDHHDLLYSNLYYSFLPAAKIGRHCARALLRQLEDPTYLEHEIIRPQLDRPPDYYEEDEG